MLNKQELETHIDEIIDLPVHQGLYHRAYKQAIHELLLRDVTTMPVLDNETVREVLVYLL